MAGTDFATESQLQTLATKSSTADKQLNTWINGNVGNLDGLNTTAKNNLVAALNEVFGAVAGAGAVIDDEAVSTLTVWSSDKTDSEIGSQALAIANAAITDLIGAAPADLNSWAELVAAIEASDQDIDGLLTAVAGKQNAHANLTAIADAAAPTTTGLAILAIASYAALRTALNVADGATANTASVVDIGTFYDNLRA